MSTYEWPEALHVVLRALADQSDRDFVLVVADDGSGADTAAVVDSWRAAFGGRLAHAWQPDEGFRLARVLNLGALAVEAELPRLHARRVGAAPALRARAPRVHRAWVVRRRPPHRPFAVPHGACSRERARHPALGNARLASRQERRCAADQPHVRATAARSALVVSPSSCPTIGLTAISSASPARTSKV